MDYSNVIRKSYSRPRNSKTTDPLVIEEVIEVDKNSPRSKVTFRQAANASSSSSAHRNRQGTSGIQELRKYSNKKKDRHIPSIKF